MSSGDIINFLAVSHELWTSGQPREDQFVGLRHQGIEVVVNLGLLDPRYCLEDEAGSVAAAGMAYHHIPVDFETPTVEDFGRFRAAMRAERGKRILVHCAANLRVSCFVALYGELDLGWTRERADALVQSVWEPDPAWAKFLDDVRGGIRP